MTTTIVENKTDDGYFEVNTYNDYGKLIKSEIHYPNNLIEVEQYHDDNKCHRD